MKAIEIYKSGGTSTATPENYRLLENLVREKIHSGIKPIVVVSAPDLGGNNKDNNRITQLLRRLEKREDVLPRILEIYGSIAKPLEIKFNEEQFRADVKKAKTLDEFLYLGEHYNAWMLNRYFIQRGISSHWIDARDALRTTENYPSKIEHVFTSYFLKEADDACVIGGFYGQTSSGKLTILPNGGSDVTADYVAAALEAKQNINLKEVEGIFLVDPAIVGDQKPLVEMTYREVRELAYAGNRVLQEESMAQCRIAGIPMRVCSLAFPNSEGTRIVLERDVTQKPIVGIASKKGFTQFSLIREERENYFIDLLDTFSRRGVSVDMIGTENGLVSIIVDNKNIREKEEMLEEALSNNFKLESSRTNIALISIVGEGIVDALAQRERILNNLDNSVIASYGPILGGVATGTTIYHIEKFGMNNETGFAMQICAIFSEAEVPVRGMSTTIDSLSIGTNLHVFKPEIVEMCNYLKERVRPDSISVTRNGLLLHGPRNGISNITIALTEDMLDFAVRKLYLEYFS
ncbi:MAG: hypothetical protein Q8R18_05075 [bacterium]|nr:hypothetical protein [bacterium]